MASLSSPLVCLDGLYCCFVFLMSFIIVFVVVFDEDFDASIRVVADFRFEVVKKFVERHRAVPVLRLVDVSQKLFVFRVQVSRRD